jgi:ribonuclease-3
MDRRSVAVSAAQGADGRESERTDPVTRLGEALGYTFCDTERVLTALSHSSYAQEARGDRGNERLEFLGDAVLDLVVGQALFEEHPEWNEGKLTRSRASLVSGEALAERARAIGLPDLVQLGRTELRSGGAEKDTILAGAFEAVIGALFLDGGLAPVKSLVAKWFAEGLAEAQRDAKTAFQEWAHATLQETPSYHTLADSGIDADEERFTVEVRVGGEAWGSGIGRSKRLAERGAAESALARRDEGA